MEIAQILSPEAVLPSLRTSSKQTALEELARFASSITGIRADAILDVLLAREALGTTGVGNGIAIPHGRLPGLDRLYGVFARLEEAVPFEAMDDQPVDLIFLLLVPTGAGTEHLKALARISRLLCDPRVCEALRSSRNAGDLYALLIRPIANSCA